MFEVRSGVSPFSQNRVDVVHSRDTGGEGLRTRILAQVFEVQ